MDMDDVDQIKFIELTSVFQLTASMEQREIKIDIIKTNESI